MTDQLDLDAIQAAIAAYEQHPDLGFACCSAHPAADAASALAAEVRRLREQNESFRLQLNEMSRENELLCAELAAEESAHRFTLRQRNNRSERLLYLRDLAKTGQAELLAEEAKDTLTASINDHLPADTDEMAASLRRDGFGDDEIADMLGPDVTDGEAPEPTLLRWGLDDVMYGDDDTTTVMLSGPAGEPYWLELDQERAAALRENLAGPDAESTQDTLPAWLCQRFDPRGPNWDQLSGDDRAYWEHQACAVRRAVARNGFKPAEETHVVADDSDDPEHIDDCPGCGAFTLTGHIAAPATPAS